MRNQFILAALFAALCLPAAAQDTPAPEQIPLIYSTDLYHPHDDPDDHFDLAALFAMPEFDIRALIIDMGPRGQGRPALAAVQQLCHITGRDVPVVTGLDGILTSPTDDARGQDDASQGAVRLILETLETSDRPVTLFTTGSLRDAAAAYNRRPALFEEKAHRLYINIGHSGGGEEFNVKLDPHAYTRILRSGLPVYWIPCFGADEFQSYWKFKQRDVLEPAQRPVQNFFIYMLEKMDPRKNDPLVYLSAKPESSHYSRCMEQDRNMWCTGAFLHAAGRPGQSFSFQTKTVQAEDSGRTVFVDEAGPGTVQLETFHIDDPARYPREMTAALGRFMQDLIE